jgi:hypothetical protein
MLRIF